jgi:histidinol-phosphate aminotransferase
MDSLQALGLTCLPSDAPFFCARPATPLDADALRAAGVKLRDTRSLGLPDHWRLSVQPPEAQAALVAALQAQQDPQETPR